jgi:outer membrane protein assembly factor BamB
MTTPNEFFVRFFPTRLVAGVPWWLNRLLRAFAPLREILLCFALFASAALYQNAIAENWDRFRGPNGAGQSDDNAIPTAWEPANFLWKQPLPGIGHGSPVIWENRIFLISADGATGTQIVSAHDLKSGAPLWQKKLDASKYHIHDLNSLASTTPAVDADYVYVVWLSGGEVSLAAFNHAGDEQWRRSIGPFEERHGFGISPIVVDDLVYVSRNSEAESAISAYDRKTGDVRWTLARDPSTTAFSTPCLLDPSAKQKLLLATSTATGLDAIDALTGTVVWHGFEEDLDQRCVSSPVVANGLVLVGCGQGGNGKLLMAVRPGDEASPPQEVYRVKQNMPQVPTPVVAGDLLFVVSDKGVASCYDVATGKQHWRERIGGDYHSSPIRIGNRIFCFSRGGEAVVLAADKDYELLARNNLNEPCIATPAIANHRLYVRTESTLACIGNPTTN